MNETVIRSVEEGLQFLETMEPKGYFLKLAISDSLTFAGQRDTMGAGMAIILDKILDFGFEPEGFEQRDGYKLYKFKEMG